MNRTSILMACVLTLLLGACARQEAASYALDGDQNHSLSIMREIYPWSSGWDMKLVTTNTPKCLRRHAMAAAPEKNFNVELFHPENGVFILHQGGNWYVTEMAQCRMQKFETPPPVPGEFLGAFVEQQKVLVFVDAAGKATRPVPLER